MMDRIVAGDVAGVGRAMRKLTSAQRAGHAETLAEFRTALLCHKWEELPQPERFARLAAEFAAQPDPSTAGKWLTRMENHYCQKADISWEDDKNKTAGPHRWVVEVVDHWTAEQQTELVAAIDSARKLFPLADYLIRRTGCPPPTSRSFLLNWLSARWYGGDPDLVPNPPGMTFGERVRNDPLAPILLPIARTNPDKYMSDSAQAELIEAGLISGDHVVDLVFRRVDWGHLCSPRGDKALVRLIADDPRWRALAAEYWSTRLQGWLERVRQTSERRELRSCLEMINDLPPALAQHAAVGRDYLMLLDLWVPVAEYARVRLAELDEAGLIEPELVTETTRRLLRRADKKLIRAHLTWLDRTARRDPARAGQLVRSAALAFGHPDIAVQEQALKMIARHLDAASAAEQVGADEPIRAVLQAAADRLTPALSAQAADLFGPVARRDEPYVETLPLVRAPAAVPEPLGTPAEVAEQVAAVLAGSQDIVLFEQALDGLVRHSVHDRAGLAAALVPVVRRGPGRPSDCTPVHLWVVVQAVTGAVPDDDWLVARCCCCRGEFSPPGQLLAARIREAAVAVRAGDLPYLLAVPTDATGALDAAVLVERLTGYAERGIAARSADLGQALLRVIPTTDERIIDAADRLPGDAGRQLSSWLRAGGYPHQPSTPDDWDKIGAFDIVHKLINLPGAVTDLQLPADAERLFRTGTRWDRQCRNQLAAWVATLPHHRDRVANCYYDYSAREPYTERDRRAWMRLLPQLAESGGPADFALHLRLALAMDADRPRERAAAIDATLVLAARGDLNGELLGRQIVKLGPEGYSFVTLSRAIETLGEMAATGAYATVWSVCRGALPGLLEGEPVARGVGKLLTLAVECVLRCGASGEIPQVTTVAARRGSSELVKSARALVAALAGTRR